MESRKYLLPKAGLPWEAGGLFQVMFCNQGGARRRDGEGWSHGLVRKCCEDMGDLKVENCPLIPWEESSWNDKILLLSWQCFPRFDPLLTEIFIPSGL